VDARRLYGGGAVVSGRAGEDTARKIRQHPPLVWHAGGAASVGRDRAQIVRAPSRSRPLSAALTGRAVASPWAPGGMRPGPHARVGHLQIFWHAYRPAMY